jgi:tripartite-type tricarboxylate transporter receptor subunit TctC
MKKLFLVLLFVVTNLHSQELIKIIWPFSENPSYSSAFRLVETLNKNQTDYVFVLESKTGAGGALAANYVSRCNNCLLLTSISFIIKGLDPQQNIYELEKFRPVFVQSAGIPVILVSKKYKKMEDVLNLEHPMVGVSALGGITDISARALTNDRTEIIGFRSAGDSLIAAYGEHIDASVSLYSEVKSRVDRHELYVLDSTAKHKQTKELLIHHAIYAPSTWDQKKLEDLNRLFNKMGNTAHIKEPFNDETVEFPSYNLDQTEQWFERQKIFWKKYLAKQH